MSPNRIVVLDIGKTLAKLTLWSGTGDLIDRRTRPNARPTAPAGYPALDVAGIEDWMAGVLADFARAHVIDAIVPVAHGAAAVVIEPGGGYIPPLDYEAALPDDLAADYCAQRPAFDETGSPALPCGLNLGAQLHWLEAVLPERFRQGTIVTWPQFWAWRLCGVASCEVSSFGVHTDLWNPASGAPSSLAVRRRWASRFAPLYKASDVLGSVTPYWRQRCGLNTNCLVYCGLHDSNADLLALRTHPVIGAREHTVVSTGTWFIAMRSSPEKIALADLPEARDCLININPFGVPVPSSRFMGGRETEILEEAPEGQIDTAAHAGELLGRAAVLVDAGAVALPAFQAGVGPYPHHRGRWISRPEDQLGRRALAGLYLALMLDTSLGLIGAAERLVIQGRFLADPVFARALKSLRPADKVYLAPSGNSLCYGALSLIDPALVPGLTLTEAEALPFDIAPYVARWRELLATAF